MFSSLSHGTKQKVVVALITGAIVYAQREFRGDMDPHRAAMIAAISSFAGKEVAGTLGQRDNISEVATSGAIYAAVMAYMENEGDQTELLTNFIVVAGGQYISDSVFKQFFSNIRSVVTNPVSSGANSNSRETTGEFF